MGSNPVTHTELSSALDTLSLAIDQEARKIRIEKLLPSDWTVARVMKRYSLTDPLARKVLRRMVKSGLAYEIRVMGEAGAPCKAWRSVDRRESG